MGTSLMLAFSCQFPPRCQVKSEAVLAFLWNICPCRTEQGGHCFTEKLLIVDHQDFG